MSAVDFGKKPERLKEGELINQIMSSSENAVPATETNNLRDNDWKRIPGENILPSHFVNFVHLTAHHHV